MNRLAAVQDKSGNPASLLDDAFVAAVNTHADEIESHIDYSRDFLLDYFGFKTLEKAYLLRDTNRVIVERPQHLWMRVALGLWMNDLPKAFEMYDLLSQKYYTHATPTLFNAATKRPQLSSCFLLAMNDDSIRGIYKTLEDCALISQYGGGIGIHCTIFALRFAYKGRAVSRTALFPCCVSLMRGLGCRPNVSHRYTCIYYSGQYA